MLGGIGLTSYITATLASAMTVNTLSAEVSSLTDLRGARVGTIGGSSAETLLKRTGLDVVGFPDVAAAAAALGDGDIKGVVYDSPILRYYVAQNPAAGFSLVGEPFDLQDYGFALKLGSPLRKELNAALLKLQVSGWTDELEDRWFETPAAE